MDTNTTTKALLSENRRFEALYSPKGVFKGTREEWLEVTGNILGSWIDEQMNHVFEVGSLGRLNTSKTTMQLKQFLAHRYGFKPASYTFKAQSIRYSCSLMGQGMSASSEAAHIHFKHATGNNYDEIRMSVALGGRKLKLDSCRVADTLLHEIIHSLCPHAGHRGPFRYIALHMGLKGKMTATFAGEVLQKQIKEHIIDLIGKYPHKAVQLTPRGQRGKGSRSIKCQCINPSCMFTMRTTQKWINIAERESNEPDFKNGLSCPICSTPMIHEGTTKGEEE